jgi:hypothetical protein
MDTDQPEVPPPASPPRPLAVALLVSIVLLCAIRIGGDLSPLDPMHAVAYLVAALAPVLFALWWWRVVRSGVEWRQAMRSGRDLVARSEGLDLVEVVPGPLRTTSVVRGECAGRVVRIYRDRVEVDLDCPQPGLLNAVALAGLAQATEGNVRAREAAGELALQGVTGLEILTNKVIVRGGTAHASVLIPAAIEIALAPVRIRFSATSAKGEQGCPYCHQPIISVLEAPSVRCPSCESVHHTECWQEHGGCSVFRCRRAPPQRESAPPAAPIPTVERLEIHVRKHA